MKFMLLSYIPGEKLAEVSAASDRVWAKASPQKRAKSGYMLMCVPFNAPADSYVTFSVIDADSAEEVAATVYPIQLAGGGVNVIPLLELPMGGGAKMEKKYRG